MLEFFSILRGYEWHMRPWKLSAFDRKQLRCFTCKFKSSLQIDSFFIVHIYSFIQRKPQFSPDYDRYQLNNYLLQELSLLDAADQRWREAAATERRNWQNSHGRPYQAHRPSQTPTTAGRRTRIARGSGFNRCSVWMRAAWWLCIVTQTTCSLVAGPSGCFKWYILWSWVFLLFAFFLLFFWGEGRICIFYSDLEHHNKDKYGALNWLY